MDFPLDLDKAQWVWGLEELEQNIKIILTNPSGYFAQSYLYGSLVALHESSDLEIAHSVEQTLKDVHDITLKGVTVNLPDIYINIEYRGDEINYKYTLPV